MNKNDKSYEAVLNDAQYKKGLSIAFFNATNNAVDLAKLYTEKKNDGLPIELGQLKQQVVYFRDWLLQEHEYYYATVIKNVGKPFFVPETIEKIKQADTVEKLKKLWLSLSEDERSNTEIFNFVKEYKLTLPSTKSPELKIVIDKKEPVPKVKKPRKTTSKKSK